MRRKWKKLIRKMGHICKQKPERSDFLSCYQRIKFNNLSVLRAFILCVYVDKRTKSKTYTITDDILRLDRDHTHVIHSAMYEILPPEQREQRKLIRDICDIKQKTDDKFKEVCDQFKAEGA